MNQALIITENYFLFSKINNAQKKIKNSKGAKEQPKMKRTWLHNVEYKYGAKEKREEQRKLRKRKKNDTNGTVDNYDSDGDDFNLTGKKGKFAISNQKKNLVGKK